MDELTPFSEDAAWATIDETQAQIDKGGSRFPWMTFEQGVNEALRWALGERDENPYPEA